jgi:hypothetical protein
VGPGNLAISGSAVEQFCQELLRGDVCRYPVTVCASTSLEDDSAGADVILIGKALQYDDALTQQIRTQLHVTNGEAWKIKPKQVLKGRAPSAAFYVWHTFAPGRFFERGHSHLLLLKTMPEDLPMRLYHLYSTGCNQHSRPLTHAPLSAAERATIQSLQQEEYQATRLAGLCESARQLAGAEASPEAALRDVLQPVSRLCAGPLS